MLKPQLAIFPLSWAVWDWWKSFQMSRKLSPSIWGFLLVFAVLFVPSFLIYPTWIAEWLGNLRPVHLRALAGLIPRILEYLHLPGAMYYFALFAMFLPAYFWLKSKKLVRFDTWIILGFIINPFAHDYDLIQLIPILEDKRLARLGILASIPGWFTLLFFYNNDHAWATMTIIAPILLVGYINHIIPAGFKLRSQLKDEIESVG